MAQFLANRGYAVVLPNFRGSTGYGKKFLDAGNKEWGKKMQDRRHWGAKYLGGGRHCRSPESGNPERLIREDTPRLAGVTFTPDVYAAAVDIVGPSNLITLLESIRPIGSRSASCSTSAWAIRILLKEKPC